MHTETMIRGVVTFSENSTRVQFGDTCPDTATTHNGQDNISVKFVPGMEPISNKMDLVPQCKLKLLTAAAGVNAYYEPYGKASVTSGQRMSFRAERRNLPNLGGVSRPDGFAMTNLRPCNGVFSNVYTGPGLLPTHLHCISSDKCGKL